MSPFRVKSVHKNLIYSDPSGLYLRIQKITSDRLWLDIDTTDSSSKKFSITINQGIPLFCGKIASLSLKENVNRIICRQVQNIHKIRPGAIVLTRPHPKERWTLKTIRCTENPRFVRMCDHHIHQDDRKWINNMFPFLFESASDDFFKVRRIVGTFHKHTGGLSNEFKNIISDFSSLRNVWTDAGDPEKGLLCLGKSLWLKRVLGAAKIPARLVFLYASQYSLKAAYSGHLLAPNHVCIEFFYRRKRKWIFIDPSYGIYFTHHNEPLNVCSVRDRLLSGKGPMPIPCMDKYHDSIKSLKYSNSNSLGTDDYACLFNNVLYEYHKNNKFDFYRKLPIIGDYINYFVPRYVTSSNGSKSDFGSLTELFRLLIIRPVWLAGIPTCVSLSGLFN